MTFMWLDNQGLPRRPHARQCFERRVDEHTAADIADALRASGVQAAALAMDHLEVDLTLALRVLGPARRRRGTSAAAAMPERHERQAGIDAGGAGCAPELAGA
jgi:hypothetical protein